MAGRLGGQRGRRGSLGRTALVPVHNPGGHEPGRQATPEVEKAPFNT